MDVKLLPQNAKTLCELIIDTLKELSQADEPITPNLLHHALFQKLECANQQVSSGAADTFFNLENLHAAADPGLPTPPEAVNSAMLPVRGGDVSKQLYLRKFQDFCLTVLSEFQINLGEEHPRRISELRQLISRCEDMDNLFALIEDILEILRSYTRHVNSELAHFAGLMTEIGRNLLEMEGHFTSSLTNVRQSYSLNTSFNTSLEKQMDDMRGSVHISKTLTELKGFVVSKLAIIKTGLENKRREDELQLQQATTEMTDLKHLLKEMKEEIYEVRAQARTLEQEILLDALTGIHNRRAYEQKLLEVWKRYQENGQSFGMLMADIDHFKNINDHYGHWAGDRCLAELSRLMKMTMRKTDFLARYGGEEFIAILPDLGEADTRALAEKLRLTVEKARFIFQNRQIPITISIGCTHTKPVDQNCLALFNRADAALYEAKRSGRNRVMAF